MMDYRAVTRVLTATLILMASIYLPMAELLTLVDTGTGVSANLVLSVIIAAVAGAVLLLQGTWPVLAVASFLLFIPGVLGIASETEIRHMQYMVPSFTFVALAFVALDRRHLLFAQRSLFGGALLVLPVWTLAWIIFDWPLQRASDPVVPLAVLALLVFSSAEKVWLRTWAIASALLLVAYLAVTTSRMGSAVTLAVLLTWVWGLSGWSTKARAVFSGAVLIPTASYWLGGTWQRARLFGRDASIDVGPISLNGEGRAEAAQLTLQSPSDSSFWHVLFGNGGGVSGQRLVDAGFILDKPHNEFIRVFVDGGLLFTAALSALLLLPVVIGIMNYRCARDRTLLLLPLLVSLILAGFSLTDNALSYIWLMVPAGVLVSWSRSKALGGPTPPSQPSQFPARRRQSSE